MLTESQYADPFCKSCKSSVKRSDRVAALTADVNTQTPSRRCRIHVFCIETTSDNVLNAKVPRHDRPLVSRELREQDMGYDFQNHRQECFQRLSRPLPKAQPLKYSPVWPFAQVDADDRCVASHRLLSSLLILGRALLESNSGNPQTRLRLCRCTRIFADRLEKHPIASCGTYAESSHRAHRPTAPTPVCEQQPKRHDALPSQSPGRAVRSHTDAFS